MSALRSPLLMLSSFLEREVGTAPERLLHAARVSMWARFVVYALGLLEVQYRVDYGSVSHVLNTLYVLGAIGINGYFQLLVGRRGTVRLSWLMALSAMDVAVISFSASLSGGFGSLYFPVYYAAAALFGWVFASVRLSLAWTTFMAAVYTCICFLVPPGMDLAAGDERFLFYRLVPLYSVALAVSVITHYERDRRIRGLERERELQRQRIELSQTIHDTTAQWAYLVSMGVEDARETAEESDPALAERLRVAGEMSRTAMWELRHAIDGGQVFRGDLLGQVLWDHAATFTSITGVPARFEQRGEEPAMSPATRGLLFSVAHNAMTNVVRHASAGCVRVSLEVDGDDLRLSVSDDGVGLPEDFENRGHGFAGMRRDAERVGGRLEVASEKGTTVTCVVPVSSLVEER